MISRGRRPRDHTIGETLPLDPPDRREPDHADAHGEIIDPVLQLGIDRARPRGAGPGTGRFARPPRPGSSRFLREPDDLAQLLPDEQRSRHEDARRPRVLAGRPLRRLRQIGSRGTLSSSNIMATRCCSARNGSDQGSDTCIKGGVTSLTSTSSHRQCKHRRAAGEHSAQARDQESEECRGYGVGETCLPERVHGCPLSLRRLGDRRSIERSIARSPASPAFDVNVSFVAVSLSVLDPRLRFGLVLGSVWVSIAVQLFNQGAQLAPFFLREPVPFDQMSQKR